MKKLIVLLIFLFYSFQILAQLAGQNYVKTTVLTKKGKFNDVDVNNATDAEKKVSYTYLDGLGRNIQEVHVKASPLGYDMVNFTVYDKYGNTPSYFLPFTSTSQNGQYQTDYLTKQLNFYQGNTLIANDSKPYGLYILENSPLHQILQKGAPGEAWQPSNGHALKELSRFNTVTDAVKLWDESGPVGFYLSEKLFVSEITDENGNKVLYFRDFSNRLILKKVQLDDDIESEFVNYLETYYVYDDFGRLIYQIPPKVVASINAGTSWTSPSIANSIYFYQYDQQGRTISKKIPDTEPIFICYDQLDRPVLIQDGRLRGANKWLYNKFDDNGRVVEEGIYVYNDPGSTGTTPHGKLMNYLSGIDIETTPYFEIRSSTITGYTNQVFPVSNITPIKIYYYDDYDFDRDGVSDFSYSPQGITGEEEYSSSGHLMLTGIKSLVLGTNNWLFTSNFYDYEGRIVQVRGNNHLSSATDNLNTVAYNFSGQVLKTKTYHSAGAGKEVTVTNRYEYDSQGRLQKLYQRNISTSDPGSDQLIAQYEYNEIGEMIDKKLHGIGSQFLQSIDYRYNIRGWLTSINGSNLSSSPESGILSPDLFGMDILYETTVAGLNDNLGDKINYNGNISAVKWKIQPGGSAIQNTNPIRERSYKFLYDKSDRLISAHYQAYAGTGWTAELGGYDESVKYDRNGNIINLQRYTLSNSSSLPTLIDNLQYEYVSLGNQLKKVSDLSTHTQGFNDRSNSINEYGYDENGSMSRDDNKNISLISYNEINKIAEIVYSDGRKIKYSYGASGMRLRKEVFSTSSSSPIKITDYVDGFVYENGALSHFAMAEGRIRPNGTSFTYEYFIKDHLGNVRISFDAYDNGSIIEARLLQENHYYPFGMSITGMAINIATPSNANKNLFNDGAELQDDFGEDGIYSTYFREYDAVLGRFSTIDPLAEKYANWSTYSFAFNNPIAFNDPNGDDPSGSGHVVVDNSLEDGIFGTSFDIFGRAIYDSNGMYLAPHERTGGYFSDGDGMESGYFVYIRREVYPSREQIEAHFAKYKELPALEIHYEKKWISNPQPRNTQRETELYDLSQEARKAAGYLQAVALPFKEAFSRASLYGPPNSGKTALIIYQAKILGKRVVHQPLFEMNAIKAGKVANGLKIASKVIGAAGVGLALVDMNKNGITTSNTLDLAMSGLALSGVGTGIATTYFLLNAASQLLTDKSIGEHIDDVVDKFRK